MDTDPLLPRRTSELAALALVVGTVGSLVTMALHPTGPEMLLAARGGSATLARGVHVLAIAMQPLMLAGTLALAVRLRAARELAVLGFAAFSLATFAVLVAAAASGLLATDLAESIVEAEGTARELQAELLHYTGHVNQAFAKIYVGMMSVAITSWSLAMRRVPPFPAALAWLGVAIALVEVVGMATGRLHLDVHGFGAVVLAQAVWVMWTALVMRRPVPATAAP